MQEFLTNFHFLRPWLLLLLLLPLIGFAYGFRGRSLQSSWQKIVDARLLEFLLVKGSSGQRRFLSWILLVGLLSAIIAAAGPSWQKIEIPVLEAKNPAFILLNLSSEMKKNDLTPSRLERAKYKIKDLLGMLRGAQVGLEVYSGEPFVISPLTDDADVLINLLPAIGYNIMPINGDRLDRAIELAAKRLSAAGYQRGEIIVFAPDVGSKFEQVLATAKTALLQGFVTNIIATTAETNDKLRMVAEAGGGRYTLFKNNDSDILPLVQKVITKQTGLTEGRNWRGVWLDYGYYLLAIPLLCCLYFFRRGILVVLGVVLLGSPAEASFFRNANQDGLIAFEKQDFETASKSFKAPEWKGASHYRLGNYDQAYAEYAKGEGETALYNQGNALAKGGKIKEAIAKYEEVLKLNPEHEDAKFNLEYLKQQQNKQQDQKQDKQDKSAQSQEGQENKENQEQQSPSPSEQSNSEEEQGENDKQSGQSQADPSDQQEKDEENKQQSSANEQSPQELDASKQDKGEQQGGAVQQQGEKDERYDEQTQARTQRLREVPEDVGGLLRAFIAQEYRRNRYQERSE